MLTKAQLKLVAMGFLSPDKAQAIDAKKEDRSQRSGEGKGSGHAESGSKLDRLIARLNSDRNRLSAAQVAEREAKIIKTYERWSENNGGRLAKHNGRILGYQVEHETGFTSLDALEQEFHRGQQVVRQAEAWESLESAVKELVTEALELFREEPIRAITPGRVRYSAPKHSAAPLRWHLEHNRVKRQQTSLVVYK
jgi:hypothetical protein